MKIVKNILFYIMAVTSFLYFYENRDNIYKETLVLSKSLGKGFEEVSKSYKQEKKELKKTVKYIEDKKDVAEKYVKEVTEK